ncbi:hypothetical protein BC829DRAFT_426080 [Chytridium lagenaria]|nr:hypothetical protein BC829DRAFT_426080 [Chytridium lagenaria]
MMDESKTPLVLVACGSYSPVTYLHLRMFEMAKDLSPTTPNSSSLAATSPRLLRLQKDGLAHTTTASPSMQKTYQRTAVVMKHFDRYINDEETVRVLLIAGGDLIQIDIFLGVWCMIIERTGADVHDFYSPTKTIQHRVKTRIRRQTTSTMTLAPRKSSFIKRNLSVKYLLPDPVIKYIREKELYREDEVPEVPPVDTVEADAVGSGAVTPNYFKVSLMGSV